jgi:mannose-6-phosphate isomerase-like protein (cupin superfamily)
VRALLAGVDDDGRSCLVEVTEVEPGPVDGRPGMALAMLYKSTGPPPARPPATDARVDLQLPAGSVRCFVIEHEPHDHHRPPSDATTMHHTDTVDFVYVVQGTADLVLQDGAHGVGTGDCVVTPGVDHAWKAGPDGARFLVFSVATPPPG